jgi:ATP-dependent helicase/nuclease subunit B
MNAVGLLRGLIHSGTDLRGFSDALGHVLESMVDEVDGEGIRVSEIFEVRGLEPRFLYMGGVKDGDIPSKPELDFLLPDSVRKRLGLVDFKRYLRLQGYIFRRLTRSAGGVRLSYPSMDGDKFFLPSLFLTGGEEPEESVFGVFSKEEEMLRQGRRPLSSYMNDIEGIRTSRGQALNVTYVDAYRRCPRRFFIEKALGLEPPEIKEYAVEAVTLGSIAHELMESLITGGEESFEGFSERAFQVLDAVLSKRPLERYFKALIRDSLGDILPDIYELESGIRAEGFEFYRAELPVEGEPISGIRLRGKIDRIDRSADGSCAVVDYKTGASDLSGAGVNRGESLQLFLYAALLRAKGMAPERVGIYSLKDLRLKWVPNRRDRKEGLSLDDFVAPALKFLEETAGEAKKGNFPAIPQSDATCRRCHERPYCPYIQKAGSVFRKSVKDGRPG